MISWIALLIVVVTAVASPYLHREKTLQSMIPKKVSIEEDGYIEAEWEDFSMGKSMSSVKKLIDYGGCYHIVFYFPKEKDIFCQKNLITKGTIDAFERLFEGKIVRK